MIRWSYFFILAMTLISCSTYKVAERHLNHKMHGANLELELIASEKGDTIEYWADSDTTKPVLLLVHGFGATTKYQWYKQVKLLSKKYRIIAPNLNYFGRSKPVKEEYAVQGQVDLLNNLLRHLKVDSLSVMGVSYGGLVSVEFAQQFGGTINQMVLFDTPVKYADSSDIEAVKNYFDAPSIEELFVPSEPEGLNKLMYLATGHKTRIPKGMLKDFHENSYAYNLSDKRKLIARLLADMNMFTEREYAFSMPILLLWGEEDKVVSLENGKRLANYLGDSTQMIVIPGAAHMPNMTHTRKFNNYLSEFLNLND